MKHRSAIVWILCSLAAPVALLRASDPPASAGPDVFALAPADAWGVVSFRSMADMDKKLMSLVQQLNIPMPIQNPLTMGMSMLGFMGGLDPAGSLGIVFLAAPSFQDMEKHTVLLVPAKDMKELLSLMEPQEVSGGISKVMIQNEESFVAQKEKHAVVGKSMEAVKAVLEGKSSVRSKLSPEQSEHIAGDDLAVWVNVESLTGGEAFKGLMPMLQQFSIDPAMLKEMRTLALSLRIGPAGLGLGLFADAVPDTAAYKMASSQKGTSESLLVGLPKDRCVLSCGSLTSKEAGEQGAAMLDKILAMPQIKDMPLDPAKLAQVKELFTSMIKPVRSMAFAISGLPEGPEGLISFAKVVRVEGDPKAVLASLGQFIAQIKGGLITSEQAAPFLAALEHRPAAETIDGVSVDHIFFDMAKVAPPSESGPPPELEMVRKVIGKDGILIRTGIVGSDHMVTTFGGGADRFKAVCVLAKAKQSPLAEDGGVKRSQGHLPAKKSMEFYLAADKALAVMSTIAKAVGAPMPPLAMPELNAPIAAATTPAGKGGSQTEIFVPMELMIAVKDVAMSAMGGGPPSGEEAPPQGGDEPPAKGAGEAPAEGGGKAPVQGGGPG